MFLILVILNERELTVENGQCSSDFTIENDVISIASYGFTGCSSILVNLHFQDSPQLKIIKESAFYYCNSLKLIDLSPCSRLESIQDRAFCFCNGITSLILPPNIKTIGNYTFSGVDKIYSILLPNSVLEIGERAFQFCNNLTVFHIERESKLKFIGKSAFQGTNIEYIFLPKSFEKCENFGRINWDLDKDNPNYIVQNDLLYSYDKQVLYFPKRIIQNLEITEKFNEIISDGFSSINSLISINIKVDIHKIGSYSFSDCRELLTVNLKNVDIIDNDAFSNCYKLKSFVVMHVSSINNRVFRCDLNLEVLTIGSVNAISDEQYQEKFEAVMGLKVITSFHSQNYKAENNVLYSIKDNAVLLYASKSSQKEVTLDCHIIKTYAVWESYLYKIKLKNVKTIEYKALERNLNLTELYLPVSLNEFQLSYFYGSPLKCIFVENNNTDFIDMIISNNYDFDTKLLTCPINLEMETDYLNVYYYRYYLKLIINTLHQYGNLLNE